MRGTLRLLVFGGVFALLGVAGRLRSFDPPALPVPPPPALAPEPVPAGRDSTGSRISLNRASQAELESLPGIGPALARRILEFRAAHGAFLRPEELQLVPGIGPRKWEAVRA